MNRSLAVGLVLVVLVAGCNAPVSSTPTSTVTPVPLPASNASDDRVAPGELAPGVEASGVTDAGRLARAHASVLATRGYTVDQTLARTHPNGTVESRYVTRAQFAAGSGRFRASLTQTDRVDGRLSTRRVERFADGTQVYEAATDANATRYRVVRAPDGTLRSPAAIYPTNLTNDPAIARLFTLVETDTTDQWVENGTRYLRVESPGSADLPPLRNVSLVATVTESGLVTDYRVEYDVRRNGVRVHVVVAVTYTDVGDTTVRAPDWIDRVNATG